MSRNVIIHTGSTTDIVESELRNTGVELQQQGERLANTTGGTENGDLGGLREELASIEGKEGTDTHIDSGGREGPLLEEVNSATSGEHDDIWGER